MNTRISFLSRLVSAFLGSLLVCAGTTAFLSRGHAAETDANYKNLALGKAYSLSPKPAYQHCTDPDDKSQLTDGVLTEGYFWTQKGTVGWNRVPLATITIDLGRVEPIGGASFRTAAGAAGVGWPSAVLIMVSDDGKKYWQVGDLVSLDHQQNGPWPKDYGVRRLVTSDLETRGRFVRFVAIPSPGTAFIFTDEIEVFRGPEELLARQPGGKLVSDINQHMRELKIVGSIRRRYGGDRVGIGHAIDKASVDAEKKKAFQGRLEKAYDTLRIDDLPKLEDFRAVLPFGDAHAALFQIQADLWKAQGRPELSVWTPKTWDPVDLYAAPPETVGGKIEVHTMQGEYRAAAVNLANSTDASQTVRLCVEGFGNAATPDWLTVAEVPWTDTAPGKPVAAALPEVEPQNGVWTLTVLPGMVRQAWLTAHVVDLAPGEHRGTLVVEREGASPVRIPMTVHVYPFTFPKETTLMFGGWSYTNGRGAYGVNPTNRPAFLKHCREHFVNAPWSGSSPLMAFTFSDDGRIRLDTREMDAWLAQWPEAKKYFFFLSLGGLDHKTRSTFAGAKLGTPEFDRRVGAWISAWVEHWKSKGISPDRIALLGHDEPRGEADVKAITAWVRAIRAAAPGVLHWSDPVYGKPAEAPAELFEAFDILCPNRPMWLRGGKAFEEFYLNQQKQGRTLQFYSCSGPARLLDPYSYYRLQAWHCWKIGGTGTFFWALGDNGYASSWNEYLAKHGPYTPLFIDEKTITPGKQMEAIRESVEDFETFVMLREAVARARRNGRTDAAVSRAETLLNTAADEVLSAPGASKLGLHNDKDRAKADAVRVWLLKALTALAEK